jgi:ornithine cyclodeaminase
MLQLDAAQVAVRLDRLALIDALERAFRGHCHAPHREHHRIGGSRDSDGNIDRHGGDGDGGHGGGGHGENMLLVMPAWRTGGCIGVKLVTVFPGNSALGHPSVHGTYSLFDGATGMPLASLDGTELTRRRTSAASALAARYLARSDSSRLLMVGTGALAAHIIDSHARVRPIRSVRIWGRRVERAIALAHELSGRGYDVEATANLEAGVRWADMVSCATLAAAPLVEGQWLRPGQHIDLIGAFTASMREADDAALRCSSIYIDTPAALTESGELVQGLAGGAIDADCVLGTLSDLVRGRGGRRSDEEITLFKSVGSAIADLAAAELAVRGV